MIDCWTAWRLFYAHLPLHERVVAVQTNLLNLIRRGVWVALPFGTGCAYKLKEDCTDQELAMALTIDDVAAIQIQTRAAMEASTHGF